MNRELVRAEWRRAQQALNAAVVLTRAGCWADAVSRAYYGVLHGAKAALLVKAVEAESHAGVKSMFGLHLIKVGEIEPEWAEYLPASLDDRLSADYDAEVVFTVKGARSACRDARAFLRRIRAFLLDNSFTAAELRTPRPKRG